MQADSETPPYLQPELSTERRVSDLLERMTVAEKAGQLVGSWSGELRESKDLADLASAVREHGIGSAAPFGWLGATETTVGDVVETVNDLQRVAVEETRLGIPLLFPSDAIHGHAYVAETTVLPSGLGTAATWNPETVERDASMTATEVARTGGHQTYAPTCDVARDPRWGRTFETFGESPRLAAALSAAKVRGYQGEDIGDAESVAATAKHFPAYGAPSRGEDAAPVEVSEFALRNTFVPPFEAAIEAGVESVMPCYNAVNGRPVHSSEHFLTDVLRGELGFDGTVVSDWNAVRHLTDEHRTASDLREAIYQARTAGLDVSSVGDTDQVERLVDLVESGDLPESVLDDSVERVLSLKFRLGLFEDPYVDAETARETVGCGAHQEIALETARESMTLCANDGVLPLAGDEDVFVGGPNADDLVAQVGGWSVDSADDLLGTTILTELREHVEGTVTYEQGTTHTDERDVEAAAAAASDADVAVLALGEGWYIHEFGPAEVAGTPVGTFPTREELSLPDAQKRLVEAVAETGTPIVGVLVSGRPLAVEHLDEHAAAVLQAYYPGTMGGQAVAETLVGANEPAGRLPMTVLRSTGQLGQFHDHPAQPRPIGAEDHPASYDPLYEFGHGLSYTDFAYREVGLDAEEVGPGGTVTVEATVENVGDRAGSEVLQVYSSADGTSLVRPARRLEGFARVDLAAGETATATVEFPAAQLGAYDPGEGHRVEAGEYRLHVGEETLPVTVEGTYC